MTLTVTKVTQLVTRMATIFGMTLARFLILTIKIKITIETLRYLRIQLLIDGPQAILVRIHLILFKKELLTRIWLASVLINNKEVLSLIIVILTNGFFGRVGIHPFEIKPQFYKTSYENWKPRFFNW